MAPPLRTLLLAAAAAALLVVAHASPVRHDCAEEQSGDPEACLATDEVSLLQRSLHMEAALPDEVSLLATTGSAVGRQVEAAGRREERGPTRGPRRQVQLQPEDVCVVPENISAAMRTAVARVLDGLPQWRAARPLKSSGGAPVRIAYFVQVSVEDKLPLVRRVFDRLYSKDDLFLYLTDSKFIAPARVETALGLRDPSRSDRSKNVRIRAGPHAEYYMWPRVQVVLDALFSLLDKEWDFVVHLSESDYPVHSPEWLRSALAKQRQSNFIHAIPRCRLGEHASSELSQKAPTSRQQTAAAAASAVREAHPVVNADLRLYEDRAGAQAETGWYWFRQNEAVASCGGRFAPHTVTDVEFPLAEMERRGFVFAHGPEWVILTRDLVEYASRPDLVHYKRLVGMHPGADEIFWSTLVFNIPNFTQNLSRQGWYMRWNPLGFGHSPEVITEWHLPYILKDRERFLFTRKVDEGKSAKVIRALDAESGREGTELSVLQTSAVTSWWSMPPFLHLGVRCSPADPGHGPGYAAPAVEAASAADDEAPL